MIEAVAVLFIILIVLGYLQIPFISTVLFYINGRGINVQDILVFLLLIWLIGLLPTPFREIVTVIFLLWILSILGILAIGGLTNILLIAVIVVLIINAFK